MHAKKRILDAAYEKLDGAVNVSGIVLFAPGFECETKYETSANK